MRWEKRYFCKFAVERHFNCRAHFLMIYSRAAQVKENVCSIAYSQPTHMHLCSHQRNLISTRKCVGNCDPFHITGCIAYLCMWIWLCARFWQFTVPLVCGARLLKNINRIELHIKQATKRVFACCWSQFNLSSHSHSFSTARIRIILL